jgi:cation diffusion facilitator family transporter
MAGNSKKAVVYAFFINLLIALIKFFAAIVSGSKAMLAEAFHSVADSVNQLFLLLGMRLSEKPADTRHQFGYGKERYFWSFIAALGIFLVGGVVAIYEGVHKIIESGHEAYHEEVFNVFGLTMPAAMLSIAILGVSIVLEGYSWYVAAGEFRKTLGNRSMWKAIDDTRDSTLVTVLFEDTAALLGLVLAFFGVGMAYLTKNLFWDGLGSLLVGLLLVAVAAFLSRVTRSLMMGAGLNPDDEEKVRKAVESSDKVERLINMMSTYFGPEYLLVNMKVDFVDNLTLHELEKVIDEIEVKVREVIPQARDIYIEADTFRKALQAADGKEAPAKPAAVEGGGKKKKK